MDFVSKVRAAQERTGSLLCLGLDPPLGKFAGEEELVAWGVALVEKVKDVVCCVKPQMAFYEAHGWQGLRALERTLAAIPADLPVLLDAKRGDIGTTAEAYASGFLAEKAFAGKPVDAVTLSPYLGSDSVKPFLAYPGKFAFVLCHTSNPSAAELQKVSTTDGDALYERVAARACQWGDASQVGFVVGATVPVVLERVRRACPGRWLLVPGVGAQGGELRAVLSAVGAAGTGASPVIIPVSRAIINAADPRAAAETLASDIRKIRAELAAEPATTPEQAHPAKVIATELQRAGCLCYGDFTLASGKKSPFYIDLRLVPSSTEMFPRVVREYSAIMRRLQFDRVAGVPLGALPLAAGVALELRKPLLYPRKDVKDHGRSREVEGTFNKGDVVCVVEDLATTGGSVLEAVEKLRNAGLVVRDVVVLIDRMQGAAERLAEHGLRLHSVVRVNTDGSFDSSPEAPLRLGELNSRQMLTTKIASVEFPWCVWNASGALCETEEQLNALDAQAGCGAVLTKTCTLAPRKGNPTPRWHCNLALSINSMGLPNAGVEFFAGLAENGGKGKRFNKPLIMSATGNTYEDTAKVLERLAAIPTEQVNFIELNLSCPNVVGKPQIAYDTESMHKYLELIANTVKIPWGVKLPPFFDPVHFEAAAAELSKYASRGLSFVTCVNSLGNGLVIDPESEQTVIAPRDGFGGVGGSVIKPTALANVRMFRKLLPASVAIIGCGGVETGVDAFEHILAGASAVQVGTELVRRGTGCIERICTELAAYMALKGYKSLTDFQSKLKVRPAEGNL